MLLLQESARNWFAGDPPASCERRDSLVSRTGLSCEPHPSFSSSRLTFRKWRMESRGLAGRMCVFIIYIIYKRKMLVSL